MKPPIFVRPLSDTEKEQLKTALRSSDAFVLRRGQIILASDRKERASQIACSLGGGSQTVRDVIHDFDERGLDALVKGSSRPAEVHAAFDEEGACALKELLHQSPRNFGMKKLLDVGTCRGGQLRARSDRKTGQRRDHPGHPGSVGATLAAGQTLDRDPDPEYTRKKGIATG